MRWYDRDRGPTAEQLAEARRVLVGLIVYPAFRPQKYGRILSVQHHHGEDGYTQCYFATVKWANGTATEEPVFHLESLETLAAEHRRKADKWDAILAKAKRDL